MSFLAQVSYTGNGSTTQYSITFPYIDVTHVKAYLDGVLTTAYTISSSTLTFTTAPANGVVIRIERETPNNNRLVDFTDGSVLTESDLDRSADQNFYIAQEITDDSSSKLGLDTDDKYDANNKVIKNLANPVNDTDAVNKQFISTNLPNITTVAGISADVTTVAGISGNVTTVAGNNANVSTVATNIASVNTVATNIADVITVANDLNEAISEIETTANDLNEAVSEIDTVGTNIASVQTVGTNIANVNTVAGSIANVNSVAGNSTNINAVAGNATNINAVNANSSNINAVNANSANINTVAGNNANVSTVAGISGNVTTVAGISADVTAVAGDATDIGTVATDIANVNTVAGSIANVNSVATNIANVNSVAGNSANINAVAGNATNINAVNANSANINTVAGANANVTTVAGSIANVNTVATNINSVNNFGERYRVQAGEPSTNNDEGDLVYDTTANAVKVYNGTSFDTIQQGITDVAPTRHSIRPSLNLDFANSKVLDPRITFTRGSNATYYDGYTSVKAEENLYSYSQEFDNGAWSKNAITVTADDIIAPDGTTTAERLTATSTLGAYINRGSIMQNGEEYTLSIYAKAGTADNIRIANITSGTTAAWFDLSTGTIGTQNGASNTATITDVGNGWYRCTRTFGSVTANGSIESIFGINDADGATTAPLNGYLYVWGAQIEKRSSATAYTATTTAPITKYQPALQTAGNNVARFDHNPTTGESLGLLIEESRTNLFIESEDFASSAWQKTGSTVEANVIIAPDGTLTGTKHKPTSGTGNYHYIGESYASGTSGDTFTASIYAKAGEYDNAIIWIFPGNVVTFGAGEAIFDLTNGTITKQGEFLPTITDVGNGWYKLTVTFTLASTGTFTVAIGALPDGETDQTWLPTNDFNGAYFWGAQLEQGSFPTSYIKTTGSQVTRSNEEAVIDNIDTSDWYKQGVGTWFADFKMIQDFQNVNGGNDSNLILNLNDNSSNVNRFDIYVTGGVLQNRLRVLNNNYDSSLSSLNSFGGKVVLKFENQNHLLSFNGTTSTPNTSSPFIPIFTQLKIGRGSNITGYLDGRIKKVSYYPKALTDNEITDLSEE